MSSFTNFTRPLLNKSNIVDDVLIEVSANNDT